MTSLPRSVKLLIAGATLLGIGCVAIRVPDISGWGATEVLAVILISTLTILTERHSIPLRHGSETVNFALTDGVWAGALLLVTPSVLTVSVLLGVGVGQALNRWKPYKIAYNVSQFLIGITLAEAAYAILGISGDGPTDPVMWIAVLGAMYVSFAVNTTSIMLVVSMVEGTRFLDVFRLPLSLNVVHWLGNMALGILAAVLWTLQPIALLLMIAPVALTFTTYRRWVESIRERDQMRDLYEAGRALSGPLASDGDFGGFLSLLEKLLPADRVELVVVEGNRVAVHASAGIRHLMVEDADAAPLEAFVAVRSGVSPQIAMVGDGQDVRGVLAVYRSQVLTGNERLLLDGLADQIAVRLQDHRLFGTALERARLSEIVSHTSDGVFMVDTRGRITTWNPAMEALSGYAEREAVGRRCEDLLGLDRDLFFFEDDAGDGEPRDLWIRTSEDEKQVRLRTSVIRDEEGAPPARIAVVRDVGEEARAEQIKRDFVSMVSHELRTPLTPLKGFLLSLVEGTVEDSADKRQEYYRIMLRQAQRLERTVNDMLDASQIEAGGLVIDLQPVPLDHVLTRLVREFREQHPERTVRLGDVGRSNVVLADPFRVEQVVLNLLSNADKYTPADLPISVSAVRIGQQATISVRDRGEGIAPEHRDRIFDRFFRVTEGDGPRRQGSGLGLYIARTLVEAMGGRIWVYSDVGVGTTFSFSLPIVDLAIVEESEPFELPASETIPTALVRG
jgi:PAS domain S-box-containing protein